MTEPRQGWRERYAARPKASISLRYQGYEIRAHVTPDGTPWVVLADIFRALEKRKTWLLRRRIQDPQDILPVLAWVPNAATPAGGGGAMIQATNEAGLRYMLSVSDEKAVALYEWFIKTGLPQLRAGG
ncbi:MAG TPA: hypothetical protein VE934_13485 [Polaromonas sp.]|uniref:hypothetical protein n=1 Tax=Polaromonas sp. TaxID=1869339 RepID=UPI002D331866|nr:hypothetical protein [Polaromonas sp.]HYW57972.1 hypothetical protein [Polaromonas sp.]